MGVHREKNYEAQFPLLAFNLPVARGLPLIKRLFFRPICSRVKKDGGGHKK
jgi:hypothetical protein